MSDNDGYISEHGGDWDLESLEKQQVSAIPVKVINANTEQVAPQFANLTTWNIPQFGQPQGTQPVYAQILQKRQNRFKAQMILNLGTATSVVLNTTPDKLTGSSAPQGMTLTQSGILPPWENERPCYAVAVGGLATISVNDQSYGQQQLCRSGREAGSTITKVSGTR